MFSRSCGKDARKEEESMVWEQVPGSAQDIGVGADGEEWVIGRDQGIYRWNGRDWDEVEGAAGRIAVGPEGPWVVNQAGAIFRWRGEWREGLEGLT
jgi:hypothetical protein